MIKEEKNKGISIIEVILSVAIFVLGVASIALMHLNSVMGSYNSLDETRAVFVAQEGLEAVKSIRDNNFNNLSRGKYDLALNEGKWNLVSTEGLVGHWKLSGDARDYSGNNNHGTVFGGVQWVEDRKGEKNGAAEFDGVDDYVNIPDSASLKINTAITVSAWIKTLAIKNDMFIMIKWHGFSLESKRPWAPNGQFVLFIDGGERRVLFNNSHHDGEWHHLVVTYSSDSRTIISYLDGKKDNSNVLSGLSTYLMSTSSNPLYLLRWGSSYKNGLIDDVRVYNRALSETEIQNLYKNYEGKYKKEVRLSVSDVDDGLVGYWKLNGDAKDYSGYNNNGTNYGAVPAEDRMGATNKALYFNGSNNYINCGGNDSIRLIGDMTISAWLNWSEFPITTHRGILGTIHTGEYYFQHYYRANGNHELMFWHSNTTPIAWSTAGLEGNKWYHFTVVRNTTEKRVYLYKDGVLVRTGNVYTTDPTLTSQNLHIGRSGGNAQYFPGLIDDVRIYKRALSATEIQQLYNLYEPEDRFKVTSKVLWRDVFRKVDREVKFFETITNIYSE